MTTVPPEFVELIKNKVELEQRINELVNEFESRYGHAIEISNLDIDRMRIIGPHKAIIKIELQVKEWA